MRCNTTDRRAARNAAPVPCYTRTRTVEHAHDRRLCNLLQTKGCGCRPIAFRLRQTTVAARRNSGEIELTSHRAAQRAIDARLVRIVAAASRRIRRCVGDQFITRRNSRARCADDAGRTTPRGVLLRRNADARRDCCTRDERSLRRCDRRAMSIGARKISPLL